MPNGVLLEQNKKAIIHRLLNGLAKKSPGFPTDCLFHVLNPSISNQSQNSFLSERAQRVRSIISSLYIMIIVLENSSSIISKLDCIYSEEYPV